MSANVTTFEVKVIVRNTKSPKEYNWDMGRYVYNGMVKMFHIVARTQKQAVKKAQKYGRPISVHKADTSMMYGDFEKLKLNQDIIIDNPYKNAVAMDSMIWNKRNKRLGNKHKDDQSY